jgi:hypothetical protein
MRGAVVIALVFAGPLLRAADREGVNIVGCSASGRCASVSMNSVARVSPQLDFAWIWTSNMPPRRVDAKDLMKAVTDGPARGEEPASLRLRPSPTEQGESLTAIAGPIQMWTEVPEDLLPRFECREAVSIPVWSNDVYRVRFASNNRTSLWTDVRAGARTIPLFTFGAREIAVQDFKGKPLPEAAVSILRVGAGFERSEVIARQETDRAGRLLLPNAAGVQNVALVVTHPDHAPSTVTGRLEDLPAEVRLKRGAALSGRVTRRERRTNVPVEGASVALEAWIDGSSALYAKQVLTAADGSFRVSCIPRGKLSVAIARDGLAVWRDELDADSELMELAVVMQPEATTVLKISNDVGEPVPAAIVKLAGESHRANASGSVRLRGLDPYRDANIVVSAPGMLATDAKLTSPVQRETPVTLQRGVMVRGSCVGPDKSSVGGGHVTARFGNRDATVPLLEDGRFELTLPPNRTGELSIVSNSGQDLTLSFETGEPGTAKDIGAIVLQQGTVVRGRVVNGEQGPVALARVWTLKPSPEGPIVAWLRRHLAETTTGEDGSFELRGLTEAPVVLRVEAPGFARLHIEVAPDPAVRTLDLGDLALTPGSDVTIETEQKEGSIAELDLRGLWLPADLLVSPVSNGAAIFKHVSSGDYRARVRNGRSIECTTEVHVSAGEGSEVSCTNARVRVSGRVLVGERAARGGSLVWTADDAAPTQAMIVNRYSPGGLRQQQSFGGPSASVTVVVEDDGSFRTSDVGPGRWNVALATGDGAIARGVVVDVPRGSEFACTVRYQAGTLRGVVLEPDGRPARNATVTDMRDGQRTRARPDGTFVLAGLRGGVARLVAETAELRSEVVEEEIGDGDAGAHVEIRLRRTSRSTIPIRLRDSAGAPASGAFVFVEVPARPPTILTTDSDGTVAFRIPAEGATRLRVAALAAGEWSLGDWVSLEEIREQGLSVRVPRGGLLAIRGAKDQAAIEVGSASGWSVSTMLRLLGIPLARSEDALRVAGLPPGSYSVHEKDRHRLIAIDAGGVVDVDMNE